MLKTTPLLFFSFFTISFFPCCMNTTIKDTKNDSLVHIITLAPGHFHAALLQKVMYKDIDSTVYVFAPKGPEVNSHLDLISSYNNRLINPTSWIEKVYTGTDYVDKMLKLKPGNLVIIAGNNKMKIEYIKESIKAKMNVLGDKPLAITKKDFEGLLIAFKNADKNGVMLYDIMTNRYKVINILQKMLLQMPFVFGEMKAGNLENPTITMENRHYFLKEVSGKPLIRPAWYFDTEQQGEGIVDVTTHLVDLIQWECFPNALINYSKDVKMLKAKHWETALTAEQFMLVTNESYPDYLSKDIQGSILHVFANGEMNYTIKGIHARVSAIWDFEPPEGEGDSYSSTIKGTKANLKVKQGKEQNYKPVLYIENIDKRDEKNWNINMTKGLEKLREHYPEINLKKSSNGWEVIIPEKYEIDHEQQFALVIKTYLKYLKEGTMPKWEIAGMISKYYTTTQALEMAKMK
jgi:predicted dehydrogenase